MHEAGLCNPSDRTHQPTRRPTNCAQERGNTDHHEAPISPITPERHSNESNGPGGPPTPNPGNSAEAVFKKAHANQHETATSVIACARTTPHREPPRPTPGNNGWRRRPPP